MNTATLLKNAETNKELKLESAFFPGEKIASLLKLLKKHTVKIDVQTSMLNAWDLVIEYSGPSVGRVVFHGHAVSRPEAQAMERAEILNRREQEKRDAAERKEKIKAAKLESDRVKKLSKKWPLYSYIMPGSNRDQFAQFNAETMEVTTNDYKGLTRLYKVERCGLTGGLYFFEDGVHAGASWIKKAVRL